MFFKGRLAAYNDYRQGATIKNSHYTQKSSHNDRETIMFIHRLFPQFPVRRPRRSPDQMSTESSYL